MAIVARKRVLQRWALDHDIEPKATVLAAMAGLSPRTMQRVFAGERVSNTAYDAISSMVGDWAEKVFFMCSNAEAAARLLAPADDDESEGL